MINKYIFIYLYIFSKLNLFYLMSIEEITTPDNSITEVVQLIYYDLTFK